LARRLEVDESAPRSLLQRLHQLEREESYLATAPEGAGAQRGPVPAKYEALYTRAIGELETHRVSANGSAAREAVRALIEKVVIVPGDGRGKRREIRLHGARFAMPAFAEQAVGGSSRNEHTPRQVSAGGCVTSLVAGTGHSRNQRFSYTIDLAAYF